MEEGFSKYDPTEYLTSEAEIKAYLDEAMTIGEPNLISAVLDDIAKARSMAKPCKNASDLGEIE
ncbi:hypothetical protein NQU91_11015 [Aeromonas hydrophila]|uniref:Addiction module antidote protein n=1 Tax=Aeromonas caviae TaxID=648 RepID=A0A7D5UKV0_AERCA|nr:MULTISPECIES: hypothetical protein [Aeromonas]QJT27667.1 hypothetical protein E4185_17445 [Aeromonas media]QJT27689.1 hypothetical protein E4185_17580 [Aeromonas media]QLI60505.1 hypothetical protein C1C91_23330 [Aeromonas caviae]UUM71268.1 hypothetical protein NQU91_11015 [Aeromonas hydrophila]